MQTNGDSNHPAGREDFFALLRDSVEHRTLVRLILSKYRGGDPGLRRITVRLVTLKGRECLSFLYRYPTKDITRNVPAAEGLETVRGWLGQDFRSGHLFATTGNAQIEFDRKAQCTLRSGPPTHDAVPAAQHDREKQRLIEPGRPFLLELGVTNARHEVFPSMSRKWKQINVFLDLFRHALATSPLAGESSVRVVDFGSGKGYLTFAVHDYLRNTLGITAHVTGVEERRDLVRLCSDVAAKLGLDTLRFCQGNVRSYAPEPIQVLIALHACDTATDLALHLGIRAGAAILMCAPCCHKELRPQLRSPPVLNPVLRFGAHLGQEAEMVTDSLRALLLEAAGYETQVFEFISLEHTSKNRMILAVQRPSPTRRAESLAQFHALKEFYGIRSQCLESLLQTDGLV